MYVNVIDMGAPSFSGRGGEGGGGGQDKARGAPFDSREYIVRFQPIQPAGVGAAVCFQLIQ